MLRAALLAACGALLASGAEVATLTADSFAPSLKASDVLVVNFYLPYCAHSKKWAPEFRRAVQRMPGGAKVAAGEVDASAHPSLAKYASQDLLPEVRIFFHGSTAHNVRYSGERTAEGLLRFINRAAGGLREAETAAQMEAAAAEARGDEEAVLVEAYFADEHAAERDAFLEVFHQLRGTHRFVVGTADAAAAAGRTVPSVYASRAGEEPERYSGSLQDDKALAKFAAEKSFALFGEMRPGHVFEAYAARGLPLGWLFTDASAASEAAKGAARSLAAELAGRVSMVWIDGAEYAQMMAELGLPKGAKLPAFAVENGTAHYAYSGAVAEAPLRSWLQSVLDGKARRTVRSQEAPAVPQLKGLRTLVGSTAEAYLRAPGTDVLLLLYAPWCSHSQAVLAPYRDLAEKVEQKPLKVAMIDASVNDLPTFDLSVGGNTVSLEDLVDGYPTILYIKASGKETAVFSGDRTLQGLSKFVAEHSGDGSIDAEL